jgi:hypothetical protein
MSAPRRLLLLALALLAVPLALPGAASAATARAAACPTFTVLHNDRIGGLVLPAGGYTLTPRGLSCAQAATNFANFLNYPSGLLPSPWTVNAAARTFSNGRVSFRVSRGGTPPTPPTPPTGRCSSTFSVLHNDRIGSLSLPKGAYYLNVRNLSCSQAASLFADFLEDWDGILPAPWRVIASQRRFVGGSRSFVVTRKGSSGGGGNPTGERLCPGTFRVLHNDRIGRLAIPKGSYYVWLLPGRSVNCAIAYSSFSQFLSRTDGRLPSPWTLDAATGQFLRGRTSPASGFRIDPGSSTGGTTPP